MMSSHFFESVPRPAIHAAILASALALAACSQPVEKVERVQVQAPVVAVQPSAMPELHSIAGTVRSDTESTLAANLVGTVLSVSVSEGDRVKKGDVLVTIDARDHRAGVARAQASRQEVEGAIGAASANAKLAESTFRRFAALRERGSASQQEYDQAKAQHDAARADLARLVASRGTAAAAANQAQAVLDYSQVRAPIDGVITRRFVDPGAQAAPGVPLVSIENATATRVDVNVPEHVVVHTGDTAFVDAGGNRVSARVTHIQPSVDAGARSSLAKLQVAAPLRAGSFVKVSFTTGERKTVTVPLTAVVRRGQLTSVFVVGSDAIAHMRLITLGANDGTNAEVLSGLSAGETIVTEPALVRDGVVVRRTA